MNTFTLDNKHFSVLKHIYRNQYITFSRITRHFKSIPDIEQVVNDLDAMRLISFRVADTAESDQGYEHHYLQIDSHLVTLAAGNLEVEGRFRDSFRWRFTTSIAIFAAIGAYREELASILQALMKLLK